MRSTAIVFILTIAVLLDSGRASACSDPRVSVEGEPDPRWSESIRSACDRLLATTDTDTTARVRLVTSAADLIVEVELADGRSALRRLRDPERLAATLEALLLLPPTPMVTPPTEPMPPPSHPPEPPPPAVPVRGVGVMIGGALGGRMSNPGVYLSPSGEGFAALELGEFRLGLDVRWDFWEIKANTGVQNFEMDTLALGLTISREFPLSFGGLELGASPRVLAETQSYQGLDSASESGEIADTSIDVRLAGFSRLAFGHGSFRPFVGFDAELSPARIRRSLHIAPVLPALPSWGMGVQIGLAWDQQ